MSRRRSFATDSVHVRRFRRQMSPTAAIRGSMRAATMRNDFRSGRMSWRVYLGVPAAVLVVFLIAALGSSWGQQRPGYSRSVPAALRESLGAPVADASRSELARSAAADRGSAGLAFSVAAAGPRLSVGRSVVGSRWWARPGSRGRGSLMARSAAIASAMKRSGRAPARSRSFRPCSGIGGSRCGSGVWARPARVRA